MLARAIAFASAVVFISSCSITTIPPILPSCPTETGHFFDYLECAWPEEKTKAQDGGKGNLDVARIVTSYCEEETIEWLPALDRGVRKSTFELREYGRAKLDIEGEENSEEMTVKEWDSFDTHDIFAAVLGIYIKGPVMLGFWGQTGSCIFLFQTLEGGGFIEMIESQQKEK